MKVLIITQIADPHAIAVEAVLKERGHEVEVAYPADLPTRSSVSLRFAAGEVRAAWRYMSEESRPIDPDVVWLRRTPPAILDGSVNTDDAPLVHSEWKQAIGGIWQCVAPAAIWVNPYVAREVFDNKAVQLQLALKAGLQIPRTLMSNDPARIREFIEAEEGRGGAIYKPFLQDRWTDGDRTVARSETSPIASRQLPSDATLRLLPGIFQARVEKSWEARAHFFGDHCLAVRLDSQLTAAGALDWRNAPKAELPVRPVELPDSVRDRCQAIMRRAGLAFGIFDFIVRGDDWIFLEINQMGQFLWIEELQPEIRLLSLFCQFLEACGRREVLAPRPDDIRLGDFLSDGGLSEVTAQQLAAHCSYYPQASLY